MLLQRGARFSVLWLAWFLPLGAVAQSQSDATAISTPALLRDAFNSFMEGQGRWAFTETQSPTGLSGKPKGQTIFRIDPSLTYEDQIKPRLIEGHPPTEKDFAHYRGWSLWEAKNRKETPADTKEHSGDEVHIQLNDQRVTPDLVHARVLSEDDSGVTYEVPLLKEGKDAGAVFDTFQLTARVNKQQREFEHATVRQRAKMRVGLVLKIMDMQVDFEFARIDPRYPAALVRETQHATLGLLLLKRAVAVEKTRADFVHVTPYDERFGVKLGPMRTIRF